VDDDVMVRPDQVSLGVLVTAVPLSCRAFSGYLVIGFQAAFRVL
jgi:hypothetical protein